MAILISKCCVCGKEYGRTMCEMPNVGKEVEKVSHGYCGTECQAAKPVQILTWHEGMGIFVLDQAWKVGESVFYKTVLISSFFSMDKVTNTISQWMWDRTVRMYDAVLTTGKCVDNILKTTKEMAFAAGQNIIL